MSIPKCVRRAADNKGILIGLRTHVLLVKIIFIGVKVLAKFLSDETLVTAGNEA